MITYSVRLRREGCAPTEISANSSNDRESAINVLRRRLREGDTLEVVTFGYEENLGTCDVKDRAYTSPTLSETYKARLAAEIEAAKAPVVVVDDEPAPLAEPVEEPTAAELAPESRPALTAGPSIPAPMSAPAAGGALAVPSMDAFTPPLGFTSPVFTLPPGAIAFALPDGSIGYQLPGASFYPNAYAAAAPSYGGFDMASERLVEVVTTPSEDVSGLLDAAMESVTEKMTDVITNALADARAEADARVEAAVAQVTEQAAARAESNDSNNADLTDDQAGEADPTVELATAQADEQIADEIKTGDTVGIAVCDDLQGSAIRRGVPPRRGAVETSRSGESEVSEPLAEEGSKGKKGKARPAIPAVEVQPCTNAFFDLV